MLERRRRLPSPALVIASLALILAVGGGGFALAISTQKVKKVAKKQANKRITARAAGLSVAHANTADTATNADQLGGIPASGFTRSDCDSRTGQLKAWARIVPSQVSAFPNFSTNGVDSPTYNCSGGSVEARTHDSAIEVRFNDSPVGFASVNILYRSNETAFINFVATVQNVSPGDFQVFEDIPGSAGQEGGQPFFIMAP